MHAELTHKLKDTKEIERKRVTYHFTANLSTGSMACHYMMYV